MKRKFEHNQKDIAKDVGREKKMRLDEETKNLNSHVATQIGSAEVAGNPAGSNESFKLVLPRVWEPLNS